MADWTWIPGVAAALPATVMSIRQRRSRVAGARELERQITDQMAHGLMLWPRPWMGGRELTQIERITQPGKTWLGGPLKPADQYKQMMSDSERLLDSYRPPDPE
jgi:hypothetical protein